MKNNQEEVPAYIKVKYRTKCSYCNHLIEIGDYAFWSNLNNNKKMYHSECGEDEWKVNGTPYTNMISRAIAFQTTKNKKTEAFKAVCFKEDFRGTGSCKKCENHVDKGPAFFIRDANNNWTLWHA